MADSRSKAAATQSSSPVNSGAGSGLSTVTDIALVAAVRQGDRRAFVEMVARYQAMVCGIALGILGDFQASEDAGQMAFLTAWRRFADLRDPGQLRGWLAQIARNTALGQLRRQRGEEPLPEELELVDSTPPPDEATASSEEATLVRDALARLPETYRLPMILFYREGQSVRAVAETLGISEDAVKQRLSRGREMLRERIAGVIETVLTRTAPTAVFTMGVAVAIGALVPPAAMAGAIFGTVAGVGASATAVAVAPTAAAGGVGAATAVPASGSLAPVTSFISPFLSAMSTSKSLLVAAAVVAALGVPVGYQLGSPARMSEAPHVAGTEPGLSDAGKLRPGTPPSYLDSGLFAEWRRLHDTYGTSPTAMPEIYQAISALTDATRRRAFRAALIAEWVELDPQGGLAFFLKLRDSSQSSQFLSEWLALDAESAVTALLAGPSGWENLARELLPEIARRAPARLAEVADRLPASGDFWSTKVRDAFALVAERGLENARQAASAMTGPNRNEALAGVMLAWAKADFSGALAWIGKLPAGGTRDEIFRAALLGHASVDPAGALEHVGEVPPGGSEGIFATTTGARVLRAASTADFDATVAWLAAHPGRLGSQDLLGLSQAVTVRLNADPGGFLDQLNARGALSAVLPAIESALLNDSAGQRREVWAWLRAQPENDTLRALRDQVLRSAGWQDPVSALRMAAELSETAEAPTVRQTVALALMNGGRGVTQLDAWLQVASPQMRAELVQASIPYAHPESPGDVELWLKRLEQLPEATRPSGIQTLAQAWANSAPELAANWAVARPVGDERNQAVFGVVATWARSDGPAAAAWVNRLAAGPERDEGARSLAHNLGEQFPQEAWQWAQSINDPLLRVQASIWLVNQMVARDPARAREWVNVAPFPPDMKTGFEARISAALKSAKPSSTTP